MTTTFPTGFTDLRTRLFRSPYWKAVAKLAGAAGFAQVTAFTISLFTARIYSPEAMGLFGVITALVGVIAPISCLRYEMAIPLPESGDNARVLFRSCVVMLSIASTATGIYAVLCMLRPAWAPTDDLGPYILFLPILVFLTGYTSCLSFWCNRTAAFGLLSKTRIFTSIVTGLIIVPVAWLAGGGSIWLFIGSTLALFTGILFITRTTGPKIRSIPEPAGFDITKPRDLLKSYRQFPLFNAPMTLLDQMASMAPALLLTIYYTSAETGQYNLCASVLRFPIALVGAAIAQVFYSRAAELRNDRRQLIRLAKNTTLFLAGLAIPMILVIQFFGVELFSTVFSGKWSQAGEFSQILVWPAALTLIFSPTSMLPSLLNLQHKQFIIAGVGAVARVVFLWYGCTTSITETALLWYMLAECGAVIIYAGWITWEMSRYQVRQSD